MKKILFIIIIILLSVNVFSKTNTVYFDTNNKEQIYNLLKDNNLEDCEKYIGDDIIPFNIREQGNQVIIKKGTYIEGMDIKSSYSKEDIDFNDKKYSIYLSDKKIEAKTDGFFISTYTLSNDIKQYLDNVYNIANIREINLQLITIEKDNKILWYNINPIGTPIKYPFEPPNLPVQKKEKPMSFQVLDFKLLNGNKAFFCYIKNGQEGAMQLINIDIIEFGKKTIVLHNLLPIYYGLISECKANFISNSIIKTVFLERLPGYENKYEILWVFDYPFNKEKMTISNEELKIKIIDKTPMALWVNGSKGNSKDRISYVDNRFYYDEIISDKQPTLQQLKAKFPNDTFFK